uniref:Fe2OG dioxygenase domain-containing protein n=1 Tax=Nelumbo nucifera TaxID=4432 RepID=A0A822ZJJ1_NELNU|nr:TPA_asm: hypothetical protein HUJ06_003277 [Nelumbo nucifera]
MRCYVVKGLFHLPREEKGKYTKNQSSPISLEGYGTDKFVSKDRTIDRSDRLFLLLFPKDQWNLQMWPEKPHSLRETFNEYGFKTSLVVELLLKAMAKILDLEENYFVNHFEDQTTAHVLFNYYPPCSNPNLVYGLKPHTNGSMVTIVLPDREVEGLQVFKDQKWIKIPVKPHALVVNIGDQMKICILFSV